LFESINEICSRSSGCNLSLYFMAQFSVYSHYTKFCVSSLKSRYEKNNYFQIWTSNGHGGYFDFLL
jgi:hypothetical protein